MSPSRHARHVKVPPEVIPASFYHATWRHNWPSIQKKGLLVDHNRHGGPKNFFAALKGVYLTSDYGTAVDILSQSEALVPPKWHESDKHKLMLRIPRAALESDLLLMDHQYHCIHMEPPESWTCFRYVGNIAPQHLKVVDFTQLFRIEDGNCDMTEMTNEI